MTKYLLLLLFSLNTYASSVQKECETIVSHMLFFKLRSVIDDYVNRSLGRGEEPTAKRICQNIETGGVNNDYLTMRDSKMKMCSLVESKEQLYQYGSDVYGSEKDPHKRADSNYKELASTSCGSKDSALESLKSGFAKKYNKSFSFDTACLLAYETMEKAQVLDRKRCSNSKNTSNKTSKQLEDCQLGINPAVNCPNYSNNKNSDSSHGVKTLYKGENDYDFRDNARKPKKRFGRSASTVDR